MSLGFFTVALELNQKHRAGHTPPPREEKVVLLKTEQDGRKLSLPIQLHNGELL